VLTSKTVAPMRDVSERAACDNLLEGLVAVPNMWPCGAGLERSTEELQVQSNDACQPSVGHSGWHPLTEPLLWQVRVQTCSGLLLLHRVL